MSLQISQRQQSILDFIRENGQVQVEPLAEALNVTPQTIRRDLNRLYQLRLLQRVHGGAVIKDSVENLGYGARKVLNVGEKTAIGRCAAEIVPDHSSLFINIGTTTEKVAEHLCKHRGLLVITNNVNVAGILWPIRNIEVMIAGGGIRNSDGGIIGGSTEDFLEGFKADFAVMGTSAIDPSGEIFDYDLREVRVAQTMIRRARSVILVSDSMKFRRNAPIKIGDLSQVDYLVTDDGVPDSIIELCRSYETKVKAVSAPEVKSVRTN